MDFIEKNLRETIVLQVPNCLNNGFIIHTGIECINYETIKDIVKNPFLQKTMELNDVIIQKCDSQYKKCYFSDIKINVKNIGFIHERYLNYNNDRYQNIIDKNINVYY